MRVHAVDPDGILMRTIDPTRLLELCDPRGAGRSVADGVLPNVQQVAETVGETLRASDRAPGWRAREALGDHKASMLQDVENGRPMDVEGVTGAVVEIARKMECSTPFLDAVHGAVSMLAWVLEKKCKSPAFGNAMRQ